jgi:2-iminoacetate synthase ThiH
MENGGRDFTLNLGNKIISFSKEEIERIAKAVQPLFDEYLKNMKGRGLP